VTSFRPQHGKSAPSQPVPFAMLIAMAATVAAAIIYFK
jgi:hypothetical protein